MSAGALHWRQRAHTLAYAASMPTRTVRAGSLDDPIWSGSDVDDHHAPERRHGRVLLVSVVIVCALIVAVPFVLLAAKHHHAGGDPGGGILQSVEESFASVLPPGAHVTTTRFTEPHWSDGCGWSDVSGSETFSTVSTEAEVTAQIDTGLTTHGWTRLLETGTSSSAWTQGASTDAKRIELTAGSTTGTYRLTEAASPSGQACDGG